MPNSNEKFKDEKRQVCRDFLRNVCMRGDDCKYYHPSDRGNKAPPYDSKDITFCHDYQNGKCLRFPCKFLHCTNEEEDFYKRTGELPPHVMQEPWNKRIIAADLASSKLGASPVCKDFLNGECTRRSCKFRHMTMRDFQAMTSIKAPTRSLLPPQPYEDEPIFRRREERSAMFDDFEPDFKRRRFLDRPRPFDDIPPRRQFDDIGTRRSFDNIPAPSMSGPGYPNGHVRSDRAMFMLEEENSMLRQRVAELKKRVDDLQATNEFLLEQNAHMRINDKGAASLTAVTVPAVTITNTAQMQPAQASNHQVMNAAIRTVTASVATVPVSLAAVAGTPCSIATVSMAPVQIPPAVVTMAQPSGQNPSGGPQALPMSMSEPQGPLVSYPIMTRPVLQPNLTH